MSIQNIRRHTHGTDVTTHTTTDTLQAGRTHDILWRNDDDRLHLLGDGSIKICYIMAHQNAIYHNFSAILFKTTKFPNQGTDAGAKTHLQDTFSINGMTCNLNKLIDYRLVIHHCFVHIVDCGAVYIQILEGDTTFSPPSS